MYINKTKNTQLYIITHIYYQLSKTNHNFQNKIVKSQYHVNYS